MNKELFKNIRLGLFVLVGTALLILALYLIGSNRNLFGKSITLYANFKEVNGLQVGNNVRFSGINVGSVDKIEIINDTCIRVKVLIEKKLEKIIRKNAIASIGTDGLMGNKLINIEPGEGDAENVKDNDELTSLAAINLEDMLRTLSVTNRNVMLISANLKTLTDNINSSRGTLYTVLMDTTLASKIRHTLDNIEVVSNNIKGISDELNNVVVDVQQGKGVVGTLLKDTTMTKDLAQVVKDVRSAGEEINGSAKQISLLMQKINTGNGTIQTLISDTASSNSLKRSLLNVEISTQRFSENMEALKHNFLFSGYFKKLEKQNKKLKK